MISMSFYDAFKNQIEASKYVDPENKIPNKLHTRVRLVSQNLA